MARSAEDMAQKLIDIYNDTRKRFLLSQDAFKEIAGKERLKNAYLRGVDDCLREDGYVSIDMRSEDGSIGIIKIKTIKKNWERIKDIDDYAFEDWEEEEEE